VVGKKNQQKRTGGVGTGTILSKIRVGLAEKHSLSRLPTTRVGIHHPLTLERAAAGDAPQKLI